MRRSRTKPIAILAAAALLAGAGAAPDPPVADAARRGDVEAVRALLKEGADVNASHADGMTPLHWAAQNGGVELAKMLVYAGANLEAGTRIGAYTPLHLASKAGHAPVIRVLLEAGARPDAATTTGGATPLHFAVASGEPAAVTALLDGGAEIDARDAAWGQTPLMWAAAYGEVDVLELLLARGADLALASSAMDVAAREKADREAERQRNERMRALRELERKAQQGAGEGAGEGAGAARPDSAGAAERAAPDSTRQAEEQQAGAAKEGGKAAKEAGGAGKDTAAAKAEGGNEAKAEGGARQDAAAAARAGKAEEGAKEAKPGAQPGAGAEKPAAPDDEPEPLTYGQLVGAKGGLTPLLFAVRQGQTAAVVALLEAGADIDRVSEGDHTSPLLMAVINGHFDLAMLLLGRGADPKIASDAGATPLFAAINTQWAPKALYPQPTAYQQQKTTYLDLMKALLEAGADPNVRLKKHVWYMSYNFDLLGVNTAGATPFWRAAYATDVAAMRLLVAYGADPNIPTEKVPERRRRRGSSGEEPEKDHSGLPPVPVGGPAVWPIHAASGVGYGEGYAANAHRHVPDGWLPAVRYLVEELGADVNARDHNGYNAVHHAAARGDVDLIRYLVEKGADVTAVSRKGQTTADMANGPVQRVPPFPEAIRLLESLGSKNNHKCLSC